MRLRERKKERVRRDIMSAALRLFASRGYRGTRISDIAEVAEIGEATLYRYFPSKEDLLQSLHRDAAVRHFGRAAASGRDANTEQRLVAIVRSFLAEYSEYLRTNPWIGELAEVHQRRAERDACEAARLAPPLVAVIADGQKQGEIDASLDPLLLANLLWAMLSASSLGWGESGSPREDWTKHCETAIQVFFHGVRNASSSRAD